MSKHIFVTGGVVSALGKGITAASLGRLLKARGYKVMMQKADPYLNVDPGTMSPFQHGEGFVTDDGKETDLDLGHYERFINESLNADSNFTSGLIYQTLISRERAGDFLGGTVQVIPHVTNEIKARFAAVEETSGADVVITEIGGTVGDIEGQPFIEAMRQFRKEKGPGETIAIHVSLVPYISAAHEIKTKPTQHSVKELRSMGIQPEIIVCRSDHEVEPAVRAKLASFCDVDADCVFQNLDCPSIYDVPRHLADQGFDLKVCELLGLEPRMRDMSPWYSFTGALHEANALTDITRIGVVGKYTALPDAYLSVIEALHHSGVYYGRHVEVELVDGENLDPERAGEALGRYDGILVPGGFGIRGIEGKIAAAGFARTRKVPYLGVCLGMQVAVAEFARGVCGMEGATSTEFEPGCAYPVIDLMPEQRGIADKGATMRLGAYPCVLAEGTLAAEAYGTTRISERHRHRYEFNNDFRTVLEEAGLKVSGTSPDGSLVEVVELAEEDHPWFVATQAHPECKCRPNEPAPLFREFVRAAIARHEGRDRRDLHVVGVPVLSDAGVGPEKVES
ncbi:MAG: CTP synthase [Atopobiaceae bacterium]|nr:CTP synthase [Atopobiaceae bacterium]